MVRAEITSIIIHDEIDTVSVFVYIIRIETRGGQQTMEKLKSTYGI